MNRMIKYKLFLAAVLGCLCYGCANEELIDDSESTKTEIGKDEILLNYSIEELAGETYGVTPLPSETKINSVFYIFQDTKGVVVGSSYRNDLDDYQEQYLPVVVPKALKIYPEELTVRLVCNWETYLAQGASVELLQENLKNQKETYVAELTSLGINSVPREFTSESPLLYVGTFKYKIGGNTPTVILVRKNTVFNVTFDLDANLEPKKLKVSNLSYSTYLFQEKAIAPIDYDRSYDVNLEDARDKGARVYILPNTKANVIRMDLEVSSDGPTRFKKQNNAMVAGGPFEPYEPISKRDTTMKVNLVVENVSSVYFSNQYVPIHLFSPVGMQQQQQQLNYTVGSWPNGKFEGRYIRDEWGNGVAVSPTNLNFGFADPTPLRFFTGITAAPTGKMTREVFVSTHSSPNAWNIVATDVPAWLTIERNPVRSSILVSVEPNFTVTPDDGKIYSMARRFTFSVAFDGIGETIPVTISQEGAPLTPSDVYIGMGENTPGAGDRREIWLRDRYEQVDSRNNAITSNFYSNDGNVNGGVGDYNGRERTSRSDKSYGYVTNFFATNEIPNPTDKKGTPSDEYNGNDPYISIYNKCYPQDKYWMIRSEEAAMLLFPRVRCREIVLDGHAVLMYYVTDGTNLCFINMTGMGFPGWYDSPSTRIYTDARGSGLRYNRYPSTDAGYRAIYGKNANGTNMGNAAQLYCFYGMEFGYARRALTWLVDSDGTTTNKIHGMLRCVERRVPNSNNN